MLRDITVILFLILEFLEYSDAFPSKTCKIPNAGAGRCIVVNECDPLNALQKKRPKTSDEDAYFRQSVASCNSSGSKIKVCCPSESQWANLLIEPVKFQETPIVSAHVNEVSSGLENRIQDPVVIPLATTQPKQSNDDKLKQSNDDKLKQWLSRWTQSGQTVDTCGIDTSTDRIVGGQEARIDDYPWLVLLEYNKGRLNCGGSLISRKHVLTAAHCLIQPPLKVRLSEYNLTTGPTDFVDLDGKGTDSITVEIVDVDQTFIHEDYKYSSRKNDIGVIKMKRDVQFGYFIKPICLPTTDFRNKYFNKKTKFIVAGWGSDNVNINSEVKRSVYVPYVPIDLCQEQFVVTKLDERQICAGGEEGKDSCRGDSGGPLMFKDPSTSRFVVVGLVSSGYSTCGAAFHPAIYTYVYNYVTWINKIMTNDGNFTDT